MIVDGTKTPYHHPIVAQLMLSKQNITFGSPMRWSNMPSQFSASRNVELQGLASTWHSTLQDPRF